MPICFWSLQILNLTEHDDEEDEDDDDDVDDEKEGEEKEEKEEKEDYGAFNLCWRWWSASTDWHAECFQYF